MVERRRRVQQYAQRKRTGKKPTPLPGGLSPKTRQQTKSFSRRVKKAPHRELPPIIDFLENQAKALERMERYKKIDFVLNDIKLRHPLKRQAIHTACEETLQEVLDISMQIISNEARLTEWKAKYNLLAHPEKYEPKKYPHLLKTYGVRESDTASSFKNQIAFITRLIETAEKERNELFDTPPKAFVSVFGKQAAFAMWNIFREHVFSTENLKK